MSKITTVQECEDKYNPKKMVIAGFPAEQEYPIPARTPFFICYFSWDQSLIGTTKNPRKHGIFGTHPVELADQRKVYERLRTHEFKHIIPRLGKSINKHSYPVGSAMVTQVKDENGITHLVPKHCDNTFHGEVCNGRFLLSLSGEYFCDNCGIEYSWIADEENVRKTSFFDTMDASEFQEGIAEIPNEEMDPEDDSIFSSGLGSFYQSEQELGGTESPKMKYLLDRSTRNILAWREANNLPPADETKLKESLHEKVVATRKVKQQIRKNTMYDSKINKTKTNERKGLLLFHIKNSGFNTATKLADNLGLHRNTVVRLLDALEADGRVISSKLTKEKVYGVNE